MLDAFAASGTSPTDAAAAHRRRRTANYRIDRVSFTVVRQPGTVVLGPVAGPADVVELVQHLALIPDDAHVPVHDHVVLGSGTDAWASLVERGGL